MTSAHITQLIIEYRYWLLVPLAIIEGPVVAFVAGTLAAAGYFNIYIVILIMFVRDLGLDGFWYGLGYFGGRWKFVQNMLAKIKINESHMETVRQTWEKKPMRTMFIGKLSYGIAALFIVAAGTVKMSLLKFFKYGFLVTVAQYGTLTLLGYFFGKELGVGFAGTIQNVFLYIGIGLFILALFYLVSWYMRRKFFTEEVL